MQWLPRSEVLTFEEIERLARIFVERFGVDEHPPDRWRADRAGPPAGAGRQARRTAHRRRADRPGDDHQRRHAAPRRRHDCARPGCAASTSASTRSTARSSPQMTRRDELDNVLDGIDAAQDAGFDPVKINAVVERGVNDDEIVDLATLRPRAGRRGAVHRVHAARRRRRTGSTRRSSARTRSSPRSTPCTRSSRCRPAARRRPTAGATSTAAARSA